MYLMHKDKRIIHFDDNFSHVSILDAGLVPFRLKDRLKTIDDKYSEKNIYDTVQNNLSVLTDYFSSRMLTLSRSNAKKIYAFLNISQAAGIYERAKVAVRCKAVSMSDCYWVRPDDSSLKWDEVNVRNNPLNKVLETIALHGQIPPTLDGYARTPDVPNPEISNYGTSGMAWKREDGETFLYKKNSRYGHEAQIEIAVSRILDCFNIPHAKYLPASDSYDNNMCKCKNIANENFDMVSAEDVKIYCETHNLDFYDYVMSIDSENIAKMCVADYLLSNSDRHGANWGFYQNAESGELLCCHPLMDHNHAFDEAKDDPDGIAGYHEFGNSRRDAALKMLGQSNIKCMAPVQRKMFLNDNDYHSFMKKAVELGLYREKRLSLSQKIMTGITGKKYELFEPVEISQNDQEEQMDAKDVFKTGDNIEKKSYAAYRKNTVRCS